MADETQLQIVIASQDEATVQDVEQSLAAVGARRWPKARALDPVTVLLIGAAAIKLVTALLDLKQKLAKKPNPPDVKVQAPDGTTISLLNATREQLEVIASALK